MTNALFLPGWAVTDVHIDDDGAYQITARPESPPPFCGKCFLDRELSPVEQKEIRCVDAPVHGRQTFVTITQTRYKCPECKGVFWEILRGIHERSAKTDRCIDYIRYQSLLQPNTYVAEELGIDESTVRNFARPYAAQLNARHKRELRAPRLLGMDETKLAGTMRAVFIDIEASWPIEVLANDTDAIIENFLMNLPGRREIEVVTMDMTDRFRRIVTAVLPQAAIVADRWHVIKTANETMTKARVAYQKTLSKDAGLEIQRARGLFQTRYRKLKENRLLFDGMLKNCEDLAEVYWIKERFLSIWDHTSREAATTALHDWRASVPADLEERFKKTLNASVEWENEILNFFDHSRLTNAKTERVNRDLKGIERLGSNYKFDKIRNRALFGKRPTRVKEEHIARQEAWRATNPTCITCEKPFDEAAERAAARAARHPLAPPVMTVGYKECHACIQAEEDRWNWQNEPPEAIAYYNAVLRAQAEAAEAAQ